MSAEAAKAAFEAVREKMPAQKGGEKRKIILATVKGDIHDIGKNIVRVMLENYGFNVIDLGKDVAPELVRDTAIKEGVCLVGLSALMTTTVPSMAKTIELIKAADKNIKVMVGGAVLTKDYADMIGADFYGRDAMQSVRIADEFFRTIESKTL